MVYTNYYTISIQYQSETRGERVQKVQVSDRLVESMATLVQGEPWTVVGDGFVHRKKRVNGLVERKIFTGNHRFSVIFPWKMGFSCKVSLKPIHWMGDTSDLTFFLALQQSKHRMIPVNSIEKMMMVSWWLRDVIRSFAIISYPILI